MNDVCRLAVENLLYAARKRGLESVSSVPSTRMVVVSTGIRMYMCQ
ncbi:putative transposase for insertion sequence element IS801 [Escherichia coli P0299917.2]|nr:putative transposase for insertion sequence element IS801 [Escherichia coli P0299917.2]